MFCTSEKKETQSFLNHNNESNARLRPYVGRQLTWSKSARKDRHWRCTLNGLHKFASQSGFREIHPLKASGCATKHLTVFPPSHNHLLGLIQSHCSRRKMVQKEVKCNDIKTDCAVSYHWIRAGSSALGPCQSGVCTIRAEKITCCMMYFYEWPTTSFLMNGTVWKSTVAWSLLQ